MRYLFVLGRNPLLSEAEILSVLEREGIAKLSHKMHSNGLLLETDKEIDIKKMINELGGTVAIGKVIFSGSFDEVLEQIKKKIIYFRKENKVIYSLLEFAGNETINDVLDALKENFKNEGLKARYKGVSGTIKLQSGDVVRGSPEKIMLRDMNYFAFDNNGELNFGALEESYDSSEAEKKDMEKPYRRESLAISPRLARILINLSQAKEKETLLDPFCGIGVILSEALLRGINAIGVDIDSKAVDNVKANIKWMEENYKIEADCKIIKGDSRTIRINDLISGVATEPSLGKLLTKAPNDAEADKMINEFEELIISVLNNIKQYVKKGCKIAFTAPLIRTASKKRKGCDAEKICKRTGLALYAIKDSCIKFPLKEFRNEQIVGREFFVLIN
ncbi:MAG: hypothetical protein QXD13_01550 [Candidatus Pacearchaeota archaeon]